MKPSGSMALILAMVVAVASPCQANTEKVIFVAPETANIPAHQPTLEALGLDVLTHSSASLRSPLNASFPSTDSPLGSATWFLLYDLTPSQRYELRVCWAATQPTDFALDVFPMDTVWETPELISSLAQYAESRQHIADSADADKRSSTQDFKVQDDGKAKLDSQASVMFLRVLAAADYYSHTTSVMTRVEPVWADIILDPYVLNVLPQSLAPTVVYIVAVATLAWVLSQRVRGYLLALCDVPEQVKKKAT